MLFYFVWFYIVLISSFSFCIGFSDMLKTWISGGTVVLRFTLKPSVSSYQWVKSQSICLFCVVHSSGASRGVDEEGIFIDTNFIIKRCLWGEARHQLDNVPKRKDSWSHRKNSNHPHTYQGFPNSGLPTNFKWPVACLIKIDSLCPTMFRKITAATT